MCRAEALGSIGELHQVERVAKDWKLDPAGIAALQEEHSRPVLKRIDAWLCPSCQRGRGEVLRQRSQIVEVLPADQRGA